MINGILDNREYEKIYTKKEVDELIAQKMQEAITQKYEVLYEVSNPANITTGTLSESYKNFGEIMIVFSNHVSDENNERQMMTIPVSYINEDCTETNFYANFTLNGNDRRVIIKFTSEITFEISGDTIATYGVRKIYGVGRITNE